MNELGSIPRLFRYFGLGLHLAVMMIPALSLADNGGLKTSIAVDLLADFGRKETQAAAQYQSNEQIKVRSAEFMFYAPIDHLFDGVLSFGAHPEGDAVFGTPEIHEAYLSSSKLIPRSRLKLGQFFLGFSRMNPIHQHDWPYVSAPLTQLQVFNGEEGIIDTGLEFSTLLPLSYYLDLTVGVSNGRTWGHAHEEEDRPKVPTHYARLATYQDFAGFGLLSSLAFVGRTDAMQKRMTLWGFDFVVKKREAKVLRWLFQGEIWHQTMEPMGGSRSKSLSAYLYSQFGWTENWSSGLRFDYGTVTSSKQNHEAMIEANFGYKASEFSTIRLAYVSYQKDSKIAGESNSKRFLLQTSFILGAHPSHDF